MAVIDNKVSKSNSIKDIERESNRKIDVLRQTNSDIDQNGHCIGYVVEFTASKWSRPKYAKSEQSIKNCNKNVVRNQARNKVKTQVPANVTNKCKCLSPSWMNIAKTEMTNKVQRYGRQSNRIKEYHNTVNKSYGVHISWCGTFVNWVLKKTNNNKINNDLKKVYVKARAIHWAFFGKKVNKPVYGAIAVKSRGKKRDQIARDSPIWIRRIKSLEQQGKIKKARIMANRNYSGDGHVGFIMGVDKWPNPKYIYILGGNQWGYPNNIPWGNKTVDKDGKKYIKSVLFPSKYKIKDWNIGFFVPSYYNTKCCNPKIYTGKYIISKGDGA